MPLLVVVVVVLLATRVVMIGCGGLALDMILALPFSAFICEKILAAAVTATAAFVVAALLGLLEDRMLLTRLLIVLEVVLTELALIPLPAGAGPFVELPVI